MLGTVDTATQTSEFGSDMEFDPDPMGSASPRVVIDTSTPFGSVEEAVIRFGGRGFWLPRPFLHRGIIDGPHHHHEEPEESEINELEEQAASMLKDLQRKEQETLEILKELELTKRLVEDLKTKLPKDSPEYPSIPCLSLNMQMLTPDREYMKKSSLKPEENSNSFPLSPARSIMMELKQAKLNLCQSTSELSAIRASVESLSKKMEREKNMVEKAREGQASINERKPRNGAETQGGLIDPLVISRELRELNYEAEQFMKTAEAARSEVLNAMSEIEQRKTGLKVIEMRWVAAKKLEEAARAAESLALAEISCLSNNSDKMASEEQQKTGRISLSLEEFSALTDKARRAENYLRKIAEETEEKVNKTALNRRKLSAEEPLRRFASQNSGFRNPFQSGPRRDSRLLDANEFDLARSDQSSKPVLRPTTSIGDILSQKLVLRDVLDVGRRERGEEAGRQRVSLNQMLRQQRREASPVRGRERENGGESKHFFSKRKGLRFVHISLPLSKQSKNKIQALNLW